MSVRGASGVATFVSIIAARGRLAVLAPLTPQAALPFRTADANDLRLPCKKATGRFEAPTPPASEFKL